MTGIDWLELLPDERFTWITEGLRTDFGKYLPIGGKAARAVRKTSVDAMLVETIFKTYSLGPRTNRDGWVYDFNQASLKRKVIWFIESYNGEVDRWKRRGSDITTVDNFVMYNDSAIKWSRDLKFDLQRGNYVVFSEGKIRIGLYRPFCKKYLFFDRILNEEVYQFPQILPTSSSEIENKIICLTDVASEKPFMVLVTHVIPDLHLVSPGCGTQCFPYYTYNEDGTNRRENITDWALAQFRDKYGPEVTKWDIFHYVYALLHHPQYRERYAENLKRDLPHIPLLQNKDAFLICVRIGKQLMDIHLNYEQAKEYPLQWIENENVPFSWHVKKMRLTTDKTAVVVNESLTLAGIPQACFAYRLGNRSALDWIIDQYQVSEDKRSGIVSDPNNLDDEEYIVRLVGKVIMVSVETVGLVEELAREVGQGNGWASFPNPAVSPCYPAPGYP